VGFHPESTLFGVGTLALLFAYLYGGPRRRRFIFLAGLVGGLGVWFTYIAAIALVTAAITWVALDGRRLAARDVAIFVGGAAIGIAPAVAYTIAHGLAPGSPSLDEVLLSVDEPALIRLAKLPARVAKLAVYGLPLSAGFPDFAPMPGVVLSYLYWGLALAVAVPLLWREARRPVELMRSRPSLLPLALYPALYVTIYAATPVEIPSGTGFIASRFLAPLQVFGILLLAVAVTRIRAGGLVLTGLLTLGLVGQSALVFKEPPGRALAHLGHSYVHLGVVWQTRLGSSAAALAAGRRRFDRFGELERTALYRGAAGETTNAEALEAQLREVPAAYRPYSLEAFGRELAVEPAIPRVDVAARLGRLPEPERTFACHGFGLARVHEAARSGWRELEPWALIGPPIPCAQSRAPLVALGYLLAVYRHRDEGCAWLSTELASRTRVELPWVYRGLGQGAVFLEMARTGVPGGVWPTGLSGEPSRCWPDAPVRARVLAPPDTIESLVRDVPAAYGADFYWGVGWGIRDFMSEDPVRVSDWIARLPTGARSGALEGAEAAARWYRLGVGDAQSP